MKKKIVLTLVILIILNLTLTLVANSYACSYFDTLLDNSNSSVNTLISKTVTKEKQNCEPEFTDQFIKNKIHFYINGYAYSARFCALNFGFFDESGNPICETNDEMFVFQTITGDNQEDVTYINHVLNKEDVYDFLLKNQLNIINSSAKVTKIARKDLECYITEMEIRDIDTDEKIGPTYTYSETIEDGFETIERSENVKIMSPIGNKPEFCGYAGFFLEKYNELLERNNSLYNEYTDGINFSENVSEIKGKDYNKLFFFGGDSTEKITQTIYGSNGKTYYLVSIFSFNLRSFFLPFVLIFYAVTVILAAVILGISGIICKNKNCSRKCH